MVYFWYNIEKEHFSPSSDHAYIFYIVSHSPFLYISSMNSLFANNRRSNNYLDVWHADRRVQKNGGKKNSQRNNIKKGAEKKVEIERMVCHTIGVSHTRLWNVLVQHPPDKSFFLFFCSPFSFLLSFFFFVLLIEVDFYRAVQKRPLKNSRLSGQFLLIIVTRLIGVVISLGHFENKHVQNSPLLSICKKIIFEILWLR